MALEGDVKLPGGGKVPKKAAAAGVVVVATLIGVYYYKKRKAGSASSTAAAAASSTDQYPPDGTTGNPSDPYSTDPASGLTYGDEAGGSALSGLGSGAYSGSYPWDGTVGNSGDPYSLDPGTGVTYGDEGGGSTGGSSSGGPPFTSNAQWSQYATNYLTGTIGESAGTVAGALGPYLTGQQVDAAQKSIIDQAIAFAGNPPVAGEQNYPPSIRLKSPSSGQTVVVPDVTGDTLGNAESAMKSAGFKYQTVPHHADASWEVTHQAPKGGSKAKQHALVTLTAKEPAKKTEHKVKVPNVVGKRQTEAYRTIQAAGLKPHPGKRFRSTDLVAIEQPKAGTEVARGSTVTLFPSNYHSGGK